ncbi:MAG: hypothetical protein RLY77_603 [Pseudomonadota bacterium]|jgi:sulfite reductase (NADPH) flavoprotein alpha-component
MNSTPTPWRSRTGNALVLLALAALAAGSLHLQASPWPALTPLAQPRWIAASATLLWLLLCFAFVWRSRKPRASTPIIAEGTSAWIVAYASQTGFALELAQRTAETLREAGCDAHIHDIAKLDPTRLNGAHCLFVVSTTGEGDPPDGALGFAGNTMAAAIDLHGTRYAVLALGDRGYTHYCAFGHQLDAWLRGSGAQPLFDVIEVDNADPAALRHWQHQLGVLSGRTDQPDWSRPQYQPWTLAQRRLLNPGSLGGPAFHLELLPPSAAAAQWQAGDIAEIGPRNSSDAITAFLVATSLSGTAAVELQGERMPLAEALTRSHLPGTEDVQGRDEATLASMLQPLPHREYSIASIPADGQLELLVRLMQREDGTPGVGSGWLCTHAGIGDRIDLRIRANPNFHTPEPARPLILIGNGTGLAGLRAHLKARIAAGAHRNWLLFGERSATCDAFHGDELEGWLHAGQLTRLDRVFSRDGGDARYVQDALRANAVRLRQWLDEGAALYVCGSLQGMAPGVDAVLLALLGDDGVAQLQHSGRYRRDVY